LREADLLRHIHVTQSDFRLVKAPGGGVTSGLVAANPPYGRRLGSGENITRLYKDLGRVLSTEFNGFRAVVLAGDRELSRAVGLRAEKLHTVYNGPIRCTLAHFSLNEGNIYRPPV
jgi:23S rRNA (guanine2445-N2)-methyltransferase / 23S rRNA (guanine2069-N7)-methyltransferase